MAEQDFVDAELAEIRRILQDVDVRLEKLQQRIQVRQCALDMTRLSSERPTKEPSMTMTRLVQWWKGLA